MDRLCERPGCSERASVAYGMRPEDLVFWLDALPDGVPSTGGVLCRRHADAMVVPRGWTLDDLRDPDLHLFRPPPPRPPATPAAPRRRRPVVPSGAASTQLEFGSSVDDGSGPTMPTPPSTDVASTSVSSPSPSSIDPAPGSAPVAAERVGDELSSPWTPDFDEADDLGGLLAATSPLLARAFRTIERDGG
jgi:hypothetical protein